MNASNGHQAPSGRDVGDRAEQLARQAGDNPVIEYGARVGYAVNGLLHILIGWIALRIAWGGGGGSADQSGALGTLASTGGGLVLLWVGVIGFTLLAVWQLTEAVTGAHGAELSDRGKAISKAVLYAVLAFSAFSFTQGSGSSSSKQTRDFTASLMGSTAGRLLVAVIGLVVVGVGGYHVYKGWSLRRSPVALLVIKVRRDRPSKAPPRSAALSQEGGWTVSAHLQFPPLDDVALPSRVRRPVKGRRSGSGWCRCPLGTGRSPWPRSRPCCTGLGLRCRTVVVIGEG